MMQEQDPFPHLCAGVTLKDECRVEAVLGEGAFGRVLKVYVPTLQRFEAWKVLLRAGDQDAQRFLREAQAMARLEHPSVVKVLHSGRLPTGEAYFAMPCLEGHDLEHELKHRRPLEVERALRLLVAPLEGLAEAHAQGLVHRDLKPSNLFLVHPRQANEKLLLLDFGIARPAQSGGLTAASQLLGTPEYIAPEYLQGHGVSSRSDVYQLGLILAELFLEGPVIRSQGPLETSSLALSVQHLRGAHTLIPWVQLPEEVKGVIRTATAMEPEERYAEAGAMAEALRQVLGKMAASSQPPKGAQPGPGRASATMYEAPVSADGPKGSKSAGPQSTPPPSPWGNNWGAPQGGAAPPWGAEQGPSYQPPPTPSAPQASGPQAPQVGLAAPKVAGSKVSDAGLLLRSVLGVGMFLLVGLVCVGVPVGGGAYWWVQQQEEEEREVVREKEEEEEEEEAPRKKPKVEEEPEEDERPSTSGKGVSAQVGALTPAKLESKVKKLGWEVVGEPTRLNDGSVTLPIVKGATGGAASLNDFSEHGSVATHSFIETMQGNEGVAMLRSGDKVLSVLMPGNEDKALELIDELIPGGRKAAIRADVLAGMTPSKLRSRVESQGWEVVGEPTRLNDNSITLPIVRGSVGGAAALNDFDPPGGADYYMESMGKNDGAALVRSGSKVLTVLIPGDGAKARQILDEILGR